MPIFIQFFAERDRLARPKYIKEIRIKTAPVTNKTILRRGSLQRLSQPGTGNAVVLSFTSAVSASLAAASCSAVAFGAFMLPPFIQCRKFSLDESIQVPEFLEWLLNRCILVLRQVPASVEHLTEYRYPPHSTIEQQCPVATLDMEIVAPIPGQSDSLQHTGLDGLTRYHAH